MNPVKAIKAFRAWQRLKKAWESLAMKKEPVALAAVVRSAAVLLAVFGFELTVEQIAAVIVVAELGLGIFVRGKVSPVVT